MFRCLIVGAGQIASGFDHPEDVHVLTHAHAIQQHPSFLIHGFFDVDVEQARGAAIKWGTRAFQSVRDAGSIDVAVICSPDRFHLESVLNVLPLHPRLIVLEKPLAGTLSDAKKLVDIGEDIPILVNFSRRFVPQFQRLALRIKEGEFGRFLTGTGYYGKGFVHNGSHMIDLMRLLIGDLQGLTKFHCIEDYYPEDPTQTVKLDFLADADFFMLGVPCTAFTIFELDLIFEKGRVRILDSGHVIEIHDVDDSPYYSGYREAALKEKMETEIDFSMKYVYENIDRFLCTGEPLLSTTRSAFEGLLYG